MAPGYGETWGALKNVVNKYYPIEKKTFLSASVCAYGVITAYGVA
jgi:hypothetical protein